jgi:glutathione synthase/RimK-type ligase-like ATP-grasp enzyme
MPSTVLIITNEQDTHASAVIAELNKRKVPVFRFHPLEFPQKYSVSIEVRDGKISGEIANEYRKVALKDICAAWDRGARRGGASGPIDMGLDEYTRKQSEATLSALYASLQTFWVCNPHQLQRANIKVLQMVEASRAGLKTPATLISNELAQTAAFIEGLGETPCAIKPVQGAGVKEGESFRMPFTTTLPKGYPLDSVALAPNIFQPYIPKAYELRCVVIGSHIWSFKIDSQAQESTSNDWRSGDNKLSSFSLPEQVEAAILRMMKSFGINFASLDMIVTPEGEYVFLDLNPNGQWLWLELEVGIPLAARMADFLTTYYESPGEV